MRMNSRTSNRDPLLTLISRPFRSVSGPCMSSEYGRDHNNANRTPNGSDGASQENRGGGVAESTHQGRVKILGTSCCHQLRSTIRCDDLIRFTSRRCSRA
jgi:hypothetical protein